MPESRPGELSRSAVETCTETVWREVLGMPEGRSDLTFFELQGQSISAVRIIARIEDELGVFVDVGTLFDDPDLRSFTRIVLAEAGMPDERSDAA